MKDCCRALLSACASVLLLTSVADAQSPRGADVPDRVLVEAGGFNMRFSTDLRLNAPQLGATAGIGLPLGNAISVTLDRGVELNTPTGDVGGFANWWVTRRVYVRGDLRYGLIKPGDSEAAITQGRASATWYPWRHLGFGGRFIFDKFRHDRAPSSTALGGTYRYDGLQVLASTAF